MTIIAAADGSALGNPGPAGWAWYVDDDCWGAGGWAHGTNNMGELTAVLELLHATAHVDDELLIYCDSKYVINSVTQWMAGWKAKGWKKKDGKPVLNVEIMQAIDAAIQGRRVRFEWVKGHSGQPLNEAADRLANGAALSWRDGGPPDPGPGFPGGTSSSSGNESVVPSSVPSPAVEPEDDLFSLIDEAPKVSDEAHVVALERSLLTDVTRSDRAYVATLLDHDWCEIGKSGRLWTREEILAEIGPIPAVELEVVETRRLSDDLILLLWRAKSASEASLRTSLWRRSRGQWRQAFHQGTSERGN